MHSLHAVLGALKELQHPAVLATWVDPDEPIHPLGSRRILDARAAMDETLRAEVLAVLEEGRPRLAQGGTILLEPLQPGRLAPWIHFSAQLAERGEGCVPALVIEARGDIPYQVGETFAYDERSHGLVPLDASLNVALHRATGRALQEGTPRLERFQVPGGTLVLLLDPIPAAHPNSASMT